MKKHPKDTQNPKKASSTSTSTLTLTPSKVSTMAGVSGQTAMINCFRYVMRD